MVLLRGRLLGVLVEEKAIEASGHGEKNDRSPEDRADVSCGGVALASDEQLDRDHRKIDVRTRGAPREDGPIEPTEGNRDESDKVDALPATLIDRVDPSAPQAGQVF